MKTYDRMFGGGLLGQPSVLGTSEWLAFLVSLDFCFGGLSPILLN